MQHLIALCGLPLAGKDTFVPVLSMAHPERSPIARVSSGGVLADVLNILHKPKRRPHLQALPTAFKQAFPEDNGATLANACRHRIKEAFTETDTVVFDALREPPDLTMVQSFASRHCRVSTVYIIADTTIRYGRRGRGEKEGEKEMSFQQFLKEDAAATEVHVPALGARCEYIITNNTTEQAFERQCRSIAQHIFFSS